MRSNVDTYFPIEMLITFLEIIDSGSFNRAADKVNRTQSAVSMQIKRLEEITGRALFRREGRGSKLTSEGEILAGYARKIVRLNNEAYALLTKPELSGVVKVGIPDEYAVKHLPDILAEFSRSHPLIQVEVTVLPGYELTSLLGRGKLDVIMTFSSDQSRYKTIPLLNEPIVWVGPGRVSLLKIKGLCHWHCLRHQNVNFVELRSMLWRARNRL